jgi:hypothetical protein
VRDKIPSPAEISSAKSQGEVLYPFRELANKDNGKLHRNLTLVLRALLNHEDTYALDNDENFSGIVARLEKILTQIVLLDQMGPRVARAFSLMDAESHMSSHKAEIVRAVKWSNLGVYDNEEDESAASFMSGYGKAPSARRNNASTGFPRRGNCWICGQPGHRHLECPKNNNNNNNNGGSAAPRRPLPPTPGPAPRSNGPSGSN